MKKINYSPIYYRKFLFYIQMSIYDLTSPKSTAVYTIRHRGVASGVPGFHTDTTRRFYHEKVWKVAGRKTSRSFEWDGNCLAPLTSSVTASHLSFLVKLRRSIIAVMDGHSCSSTLQLIEGVSGLFYGILPKRTDATEMWLYYAMVKYTQGQFLQPV